MKNKKIIIPIVILGIILSLLGFYIVTKEDKNTTLNLIEKQWIDSNKNTVIDIGLVNDVPVFNYNGEGIFFDFLNNLEEVTGLGLNKVSFQYKDSEKPTYSFDIVDEVSKKDLLIYEDNYALVLNKNFKYNKLSDIKSLTIGVLENELEQINLYLKGGSNNVFKPFKTIDELFTNINNQGEEVENKIDGIVIPKTLYLKNIIENKDLHIAYDITEMSKKYILKLGDKDKLNNILIKYYEKWSNENYRDKYNKHFSNNYFTMSKTEEKEIVNFRSKRYIYGFVDNAPFDTLINNKLKGYNSEFLKQFSKIANVEISFSSYKTNNSMLKSFNSNKIDLMLNNISTNKYDMDVYQSKSIYDSSLVVLTNISNNFTVNSINSLKDVEVLTIKDTQISNYLLGNNLKIKDFDNNLELIKNIKKNSIVVVDRDIYNYYETTSFKNFKVNYEEELPNDYNYVIRDIQNNKVFNSFFDFYLSFYNSKVLLSNGYYSLFNIDRKPIIIKALVIISSVLIIVVTTTLLITQINKNKKTKVKTVSKEDKFKYIDMLTSLKNRNYLSDNIERWDDSEVYPQTIVVIDLNNIAYINDNYGHNEGDIVIKDAANILIKNQIENSEIIRTDGNEYLVYLVGYDEKEIITYIRKINKELKTMAHGFGAAVGYSMINDAIKTIDDAINEATLDMRDNKENEDIKLS